MDVILERLFKKNLYVCSLIKDQSILTEIKNNPTNFISSDTEYLFTESGKIIKKAIIDLFLIYEQEKCYCYNVLDKTELSHLYVSLFEIIRPLFNDDIQYDLYIKNISELKKIFCKIIYYKIKFYNKVLIYNLDVSLKMFLNFFNDDKPYIFFTKEINEEECIICLTNINEIKLLCCRKYICMECLERLERAKCPFCNFDSTKINLLFIN